MSDSKRPRSKVRAARAPRRGAAPESPPAARSESPLGSFFDSISDITTDLTSSALKLASLTRESAARAIARTPEQLRMMASAGESLRDMREVAGMTVIEISDALNLRDKSVWEAVEDGREALSFELILRLASLVARNDPLPFVLKYTRTYHPRLWEILHELKIDQLPIQFERERNFINIYRRHDTARKLSDAGFERVLKFTQQAFDMAIHFVAHEETLGREHHGSEGSAEGGRKRKRTVKRARR
jgi:transcriptional regulator with XRE-family HTH domain